MKLNYSTVGKGAIALLLLITTITVFVPKYSPLSDSADAENDSDPLTKVNSALEPDWKYIGRAILLVLDVVFLIATVGLLFSNYLLRKIVR